MELTGEEIRVIGDLDDLDEPAVRSLAGDPHAALLEIVHVPALDLVAVAVPLADLRATVGLVGGRAGLEEAGPLAEPHVATHLVDALQLAELVDHRVRGVRIELGRVGVLQPRHVARVLDHRALQAQTDAEEGDAALAREADRLDHPVHTANPEAAGY